MYRLCLLEDTKETHYYTLENDVVKQNNKIYIPLDSVKIAANCRVLINKNNSKSCHNLEESIINATKMYVTNNKYELGFSCNDTKSLKIQDLVNSGDLKISDGELTNPVDNSSISLENTINIKYNCNTKEFTYEFSLNCE